MTSPPPNPLSLRDLQWNTSEINCVSCTQQDTSASSNNQSFAAHDPANTEVNSNMLGARARAAEYNAAKAASARQQASRESEGSSSALRPASIPLRTFTRHASYSRDHAPDNFTPSTLSEKENTNSSISTLSVDPIVRPSSLPPIHTLLAGSTEMPIDPRAPPYTPLAARQQQSQQQQDQGYSSVGRTPFGEDGYNRTSAPIVYTGSGSQNLRFQPARPYVAQSDLTQSPSAGFYAAGNSYNNHGSYSAAATYPTASNIDSRIQLSNPNLSSHNSALVSEATRASPLRGTPFSARPTTPTTGLGEPTLYVFGPDDLSPEKVELKERARAEWFAHNPPYKIMPANTRVTEPARTSTMAPCGRTQTSSIRNVFADRGVHESVNFGPSLRGGNLMRNVRDEVGFRPEDFHPSDVRYRAPLHQGINVSDGSPVRYKPPLQQNSDRTLFGGKSLYERMQEEQQLIGRGRLQGTPLPATASAAQPKHEARVQHLTQSSIQDLPQSKVKKQSSIIGPPLADIYDPKWLDFRGPNAEDREKCRRVRRAMEAEGQLPHVQEQGSVYKEQDGKLRAEKETKPLEQRKAKIDELAKEMQHKWEHGGQFRGPIMSKEEAEKNAQTIRDVGAMMAMLSMQADSQDGSFHLGSRPYVQPPEYAIERSIGVGTGKATSLFEEEGEEARAAPARLARDPRFRAQPGDGTASRGDEERIPRMFVARPRKQE